MKDAVLCIDIGTSSLKAAYMEDSPKSLAFARYTFKDTTKQKAALEWMTGVKACLEELRMKQPEVGIEAICISGNGPTAIFAIFGCHSLALPLICIVSPLVMTREMPLAISWIPRDEIMGATLIFAITKPLSHPKAVPITSGRSRMISGFSVLLR